VRAGLLTLRIASQTDASPSARPRDRQDGRRRPSPASPPPPPPTVERNPIKLASSSLPANTDAALSGCSLAKRLLSSATCSLARQASSASRAPTWSKRPVIARAAFLPAIRGNLPAGSLLGIYVLRVRSLSHCACIGLSTGLLF
jgi:hypothetical protein